MAMLQYIDQKAEQSNREIDKVLDKQTSIKYNSDKIRNVQLITNTYGNCVHFTLVIQYNDSIVTASLHDKNIRGYFNQVCGS